VLCPSARVDGSWPELFQSRRYVREAVGRKGICGWPTECCCTSKSSIVVTGESIQPMLGAVSSEIDKRTEGLAGHHRASGGWQIDPVTVNECGRLSAAGPNLVVAMCPPRGLVGIEQRRDEIHASRQGQRVVFGVSRQANAMTFAWVRVLLSSRSTRHASGGETEGSPRSCSVEE
jgi:hypothetical protein